MPTLDSCIPLPLNGNVLANILPKAKDWAILHGIAKRNGENSFTFAPFVLTPTSFPRIEFEKAARLQTIYNELMHWVAHDSEFLRETLKDTIKVDPYIRNLFNIFDRVEREGGPTQKLSLGVFRSDYMMDSLDKNKIKQVEINFDCALPSIVQKLQPFHSYILNELGHNDKIINLPKSDTITGMCNGMIEAWNAIGDPNAAILILDCEESELDIPCSISIEFYMREMHPKIKVYKKTLSEIFGEAKLGPNKELIINDAKVAVVMLLIGYPGDCPSPDEWHAYYLIERSSAIKCPPIHYVLATTKKVQQALAEPEILKRFLNDETQIQALTDTCVGLYSIDSQTENGRNAFQMALKNPEKYILKPDRDGGGNNVYGHDIPSVLHNMSQADRSAWTLMERIFPPTSKGYMVPLKCRDILPKLVDVSTELGIYGIILGDKNQITVNKECGHLLRTKIAESNEVGIEAGCGAFDSPYLCEED